jgi:polysaccharide deacetylase family sporulation protein PdaB
MFKINILLLSLVMLLLVSGCQSESKTQTSSSSSALTSTTTQTTTATKASSQLSSAQLTKETTTTEPTTEENKKMVALTFDDGPDPTNTQKLLDILKKEQIQATFFLLGQNAQQYPDIVKAIAQQGNEIGSHTYDHKDLTTLSTAEMTDEITKTDETIKKIVGKAPSYVRPPYGSVNNEVATIINRPMIEWSVDSEDWQSRNADAIVKKVQETVYDGSIILLHDIHPETIEAVPRVIQTLKDDGYSFVKISSLLGNPTAVENYYGQNDQRAVEGS